MFAVFLASVHDVIAIQEEFTLTVIRPWVSSATESILSLFVLGTRLRGSGVVMAPTCRLRASAWSFFRPCSVLDYKVQFGQF